MTHVTPTDSRPRTTAATSGRGKLRVLGLDVALRCTGYGVIDTDGRSFAAVDCGVIRTSPKELLSDCLRRLLGGVRELADSFAPDEIAIEGGFFYKNARTAMVLGMARGAVVAALTGRDLPLYEYAPRRVKQAVCGYGDAGKEQVALIVSQILGIPVDTVEDDATDALALAICHGQTVHAAGGLLRPKRI